MPWLEHTLLSQALETQIKGEKQQKVQKYVRKERKETLLGVYCEKKKKMLISVKIQVFARLQQCSQKENHELETEKRGNYLFFVISAVNRRYLTIFVVVRTVKLLDLEVDNQQEKQQINYLY